MTIDILVNGEPEQISEGATLGELLHILNIDASNAPGIAVAVNEDVVRRHEWSDWRLASGDTVEIVTARQGG